MDWKKQYAGAEILGRLWSIFENRKRGSQRTIFPHAIDIFKIDIFSPYYLFPIIYILYFTFGCITLTNLPYPSTESKIFIIIGIIFYFIGAYVSARAFNRNDFLYCHYQKSSNIGKLIRAFILISVVGAIIAMTIQTIFYGVPLLDPGIRLAMSPKLLSIFILLPLSLNYYLSIKLNEAISNKLKMIYIVLIFAIGIITSLFTAYRILIVVFLLTFIVIINVSFRRIKLIYLAIAGFILGLIIVGLQQYRLQQTIGSSSFDYLNPKGYPNILIAAHLPCHEGATVFSDIVHLSPIHGLLHGQFFRMGLEAIKPGIQLGPGSFISLIRGTNLESGTTSSILGGPYLDFGILGIIVFMFLVGFALMLLYNNMKYAKTDAFCSSVGVISYSYSLAIFIVSIHIDLFSITISMLSLLFVIFLQIIVSKWYKNGKILAITGLIIISVFSIILTPSIFNETGMESSAIKFCSTNLNDNKMILVDKYSARTGLTFKDHIFSLINYYSNNFNVSNILKNHNVMKIKYIFVNKKAPILKSELPEEINDIAINNIYANDNINVYDINY
jgi:oligosaccharide repeat unit polymerase